MFVRYVSAESMVLRFTSTDLSPQDRESEPRFVGGPPRGDFGPGARGGFGGGFGGPPGAGGVRQIYVSNLPFNVGWQDLKDLFRSAGKCRSNAPWTWIPTFLSSVSAR